MAPTPKALVLRSNKRVDQQRVIDVNPSFASNTNDGPSRRCATRTPGGLQATLPPGHHALRRPEGRDPLGDPNERVKVVAVVLK